MRALIVSLLLGGLVFAAPQQMPIESGRGFTPAGVKVEAAEYRGRKAVKVIEPKLNAGGGIAVIDGTTFRNGTIEADVAGFPAPGAPGEARGFVGIAFRVQRDPKQFEAFYLRPTNGRSDD